MGNRNNRLRRFTTLEDCLAELGTTNVPCMRRSSTAGFSMIELMIVATIAVLVAGFALPGILTAVHNSRLRSATSDFSGLLQSGRIRAVQDNRFYSTYILSGSQQQGYIDIYPQNPNGTSGNGGTSISPGDPAVVFAREVAVMSAASAPSTTALEALFLPANPTLPVGDGSSSSTPVTFGPRGLPCTEQTATTASGTSGTVCDSSGGATAFWVFFKNIQTQIWEAVTVSPSGRVQKWEYRTNRWAKIA